MAGTAIATIRNLSAALIILISLGGHYRASAQITGPDSGQSWQEKTSIDIEPSTETWFGFDGYRRVASLYAGATWSPFGNLRQDGFRFRVIGGQSTYRYAGSRYDAAADQSVWQTFSGSGRFVDALAGWQLSTGETTIKLFGGFAMTSHVIAPFDPETEVQGMAYGLKGVLELWHNWTDRQWISLDLSTSRTHNIFSAQLRQGQRLDIEKAWSLGVEAAVIGHTETTIQRLGLFVRHESPIDEFTIAGGVSRARGDLPSGYATAHYLRRF